MGTYRLAVAVPVFVAMFLVVGVGSAQAIAFDPGPPSIPVPNTGECTAGHGYWKTHSEYGPAPYDSTWGALPDGADTGFFLSGQSYYEVLWTPPQGGNAYYTLARQYIAAELNMLGGASIPEDAGDAWDEAAVLFGTYTPDEAAALSGQARQVWTSLAWILDDYNNGFAGPGVCPGVVIDPDPTPPPVPNTVECTAGHGYWKTHSEYGPAPYDATWGALPDGADTEFFLSGQDYYEVLWTPPRGGNAYYIVARAYIAAELNMLSGAPMSDDTVAAWDEATTLFETYTPEEVGALKGHAREPWTSLASILSAYNGGLIGPGHCTDIYDVDVDMIMNKVMAGAGSADAVDVQLVVNAALALPCLYATDLNIDKATNAIDVQVVINDALGIEYSGP